MIGVDMIPCIKSAKPSFSDETPALEIMDNFKGQITSSVTELLESNNIHVVSASTKHNKPASAHGPLVKKSTKTQQTSFSP